jgi:hypothetical protein
MHSAQNQLGCVPCPPPPTHTHRHTHLASRKGGGCTLGVDTPPPAPASDALHAHRQQMYPPSAHRGPPRAWGRWRRDQALPPHHTREGAAAKGGRPDRQRRRRRGRSPDVCVCLRVGEGEGVSTTTHIHATTVMRVRELLRGALQSGGDGHVWRTQTNRYREREQWRPHCHNLLP